MKNTFGNNISLTIFGESHGNAIGCVLDGVPAGIKIDEERINKLLSLRRPSGSISTSRREADEYSFQSGVFNGFTTGTPICILIPNKDTRSKDYSEMSCIARPSHADYTAHIKYRGFEDYRGGGHFSGRITAALVAAGGILIPALEKKNIFIGSHIKSIGKVSDRSFENVRADIEKLADMSFAVLDEEKQTEMTNLILAAKNDGDSVGGVVETAVCGIEAGVGEPWFDTLEGLISHAVFSIPAVKGIEFGAGFAITEMRGSEANDSFYSETGRVSTETNNSGGINGGISNGADIIFRTAFKPTPTIAKEQKTINYVNNENAILSAAGRHDPCIVHRARIVVDCVTALVVADALTGKHGADWLAL
ncbi:MAG: chorismate synthase [Ruminococcaceae bacterium]|nr:chorismate synthase [Oscillospiraceae bacterium]